VFPGGERPASKLQNRLWRSYRYDASGELAERRDSVCGSIRYRYDPAGQLLQQARLADRGATGC